MGDVVAVANIAYGAKRLEYAREPMGNQHIRQHVCNTCPKPMLGAISDEEFERIVKVSNAELAVKQPAFTAAIAGYTRWEYDLHTCTMKIGDATYRITPIGTYSQLHKSWQWGWANEEFPPAAIAAGSEVRALFDLTQWRVFDDPAIQASSADAQLFSALAIHVLNAKGLFKCTDDPTLYLAVH